MPETFINPSSDQIEALTGLELDGPLIMLNMLRFKADGGRAEYARYGVAAQPFLEAVGASVEYLGDVHTTVIGGDHWDEIALVRYPSVAAFLEMVTTPGYPADVRAGALADSRLYCTQATTLDALG